jgi:hypothetical protein
MPRAVFACLAVLLLPAAAGAQDTRGLGLPPASGSQYPVLPPPSGSQIPALPPPSGQRYVPGVGGRFSGDDILGSEQRRVPSPRRSGSGEIGVVGSVAPATQPFPDGELNRLADIAPALRRCWQPPALDGPDSGAMATVRFSLRRDGTLFGQPRVTWETKNTEPALRQRFTDSVTASVRDCTPMRLSPQLGASIAGRPLSIRFHGRAPSIEKAI